MNNETSALLEKYFDTAFTAPDGIKKLRELILTLAMQGKLVPQDPTDRPASELLKAIEAEKQQLVKEGKIKPTKPLTRIKLEKIPYDLPKSWKWLQLNDISIKIHYGYTASANHSLNDVRLLRITDIQDNKVDWEAVPGCEIREKDIEQYLLANNDILIARTGGTVGKSYLVKNINVNAVFASYLIRVVPSVHVDVDYLKLSLESPLYWKQLYEKCSGTGQPNVNGTSLSTLLLPLPPLEEQHRIVAEIDRLMARCDELEKLRTDRNQKRTTVHTAAIDRLLKAQDDRAFSTAWSFITQHFSELYSVKENVTELRKVILQLAVMGKLVPQDPTDEPASELLKTIELEKKRLVEEGMIKRSKPLPKIKSDEISYNLPQSWEWVRLGWITSKITDGDHKTPPRISEGYRLLSAKNVRNGYLDFDKCDLISEEHYLKSRERCCPEFNDLLIVSVGGTIGRSSLIPEDSSFALVRSVALVKPLLMNSSYLKYSMDSSLLQNSIHSRKRGGAQPCLYLSEIEQFLFSLPPIAEQHRIVVKIDRLMEFCDRLEASIEATKIKQTDLLNAVMSRV